MLRNCKGYMRLVILQCVFSLIVWHKSNGRWYIQESWLVVE